MTITVTCSRGDDVLCFTGTPRPYQMGTPSRAPLQLLSELIDGHREYVKVSAMSMANEVQRILNVNIDARYLPAEKWLCRWWEVFDCKPVKKARNGLLTDTAYEKRFHTDVILPCLIPP